MANILPNCPPRIDKISKKRVCCQSISETLNESRKRTRTFSGLFVRISTLTYCIPYILHVHDSIGVCFSNISAYFARNAESLTTQGSLRKSCRLAGGFVPTRSHRGGGARRYLVVIRVLAFVSSGVMIASIPSMCISAMRAV